MASPLKPGKQSVDLAAPVRVSKIRRDPPPPVKKTVVRDPDERETRTVVFGVVAFAVAIFIVTLGFSAYSGWSPSDVTVNGTLD
ncbi:hypothetical protein [Sphingomonas daechungensis]|uniref:hypothetical protein n=1 Tax=Sphingomonas daechungensis TaxID=1176646 RepID=UPI0037847AC4